MQVQLAVLNETIGAMLISAALGAALQGITSCQTLVYYLRSKSDPIVVRSLMFFVWVMNLLHTVLVTNTIYTLSVTHHRNPSALGTLTWSAMAVIIGNVIGGLGVKGIFSYRVWKISRRWYLGVIIMLADLITFAFSAFVVAKMVRNPTAPPQALGTYGTLVAMACSDTLMSIILGSVVYQHRSMFPSVNRVLRKVVLYSAETSVVTSIGAIIGLTLYAVFPDKPVLFMAVLWILPYLISSSILFALNARQGLRAKSRIIDSAELDGRFLSYNTALSSIVVADVPTYTLDSYQ